MAHHETLEMILTSLTKIKLFESLSTEILDEIKQSVVRPNTYQLSKNSILLTPDDKKKGLFLIVTGKLRFYKINSAGKQHTVCILNEGSAFGEVNTFALGVRGSYVETIEDSIVVFIPVKQFELILHKYSELSLLFLAEMSKSMRIQDELVEHLIFHDLRGKVLYFLNRLIQKFRTDEPIAQEVTLPLTHQELADIIGATREAVSLTLKELSNEGILTTGRKTIRINIDKIKKEIA